MHALAHGVLLARRDVFVGYSLAVLPNTPGCHHLSCPVWVATEGRASLAKELTSGWWQWLLVRLLRAQRVGACSPAQGPCSPALRTHTPNPPRTQSCSRGSTRSW
jgi:hypothetical protein